MMKILCATLLLLAAAPASANDAISGISAGGIVFGKTDIVAMKKEVLNVGYEKISVDYEFLNESDATVEETISFPMPEYTAGYQFSETYYGLLDQFSVLVDGKSVAYKTVMAANVDGKNVVDKLRQAGLTEEQIAYYPSLSPFPEKKVPSLNAKQKKALIGAKLLAKLSYEDEKEWVPAWAVQISYVWKQKFQPNTIVRVHHEYSPFITAGPGASYMDENVAKTYCADGDFLKTWKRLNSHGRFVGANQVSYILRSANTWKNGIEDFTLNLVKKNPDEVVSLCFPGSFSKINPTTLQVHLKNFKPKRDLEVFFGNTDGSSGNGAVPPQLPH